MVLRFRLDGRVRGYLARTTTLNVTESEEQEAKRLPGSLDSISPDVEMVLEELPQ